MTILERLIEYRRDSQNIDFDIQRLELMKEKAGAPSISVRKYETHGEGTASDPVSRAVIRIAEFEDELRARIDILFERKRGIVAEIEAVLPPTQAAVVKLYYIDGETVRGVAYALYGEETDYDENEETYRWRALKMKRRAEKSLRKFPNVPQMSSNVPKCPQLEE